MVRAVVICTLSLLSAVVSAQYAMLKEYAGQTFFDDWNFYDNCTCLIPLASIWRSLHSLFNSRQPDQWKCKVWCPDEFWLSQLPNACFSYLSAKDAASQQLAFINSQGNAIMKVDNTSTVKFPDRRNSIRVNTKDRYTIGTLWVADMLHTPFGVSLSHESHHTCTADFNDDCSPSARYGPHSGRLHRLGQMVVKLVCALV